uniref:PDIL1-4 n=1 Tax=Arundo donax TaxID=35708 RepID=A0A0A9E0L8_ARUDO
MTWRRAARKVEKLEAVRTTIWVSSIWWRWSWGSESKRNSSSSPPPSSGEPSWSHPSGSLAGMSSALSMRYWRSSSSSLLLEVAALLEGAAAAERRRRSRTTARDRGDMAVDLISISSAEMSGVPSQRQLATERARSSQRSNK